MEDYIFDQFLDDQEEVSFYSEHDSEEFEREDDRYPDSFNSKTILD